MAALVAGEQVGIAGVASLSLGIAQQPGEPLDARQAEIEPVRGDRVHADGGIPDQGEARADEPPRIDTDQRVGVCRRQHLHAAQPMVEAPVEFDGLGLGILGHERAGLGRRQGEHRRGGAWIVQRQQGEGLAVTEPFPRRRRVRLIVAHLDHHHHLAEIVLVGGDAHRSAAGGKPVVGSDHQPGLELTTILQP